MMRNAEYLIKIDLIKRFVDFNIHTELLGGVYEK